MAEVFGVVAGAAGLVSVAFDFAEKLIKLRRLCKEFKIAPALLEDLTSNMQSTKCLLDSIATYEGSVAAYDVVVVSRFRTSCQRVNTRICSTLTKLERSMKSSKLKGRLQTLIDQPELQRLRTELYEAKVDLSLALSIYDLCSRKNEPVSMNQQLTSMMLVQQQMRQDVSVVLQHFASETSRPTGRVRELDTGEEHFTSSATLTCHRERSSSPRPRRRPSQRWRIRSPVWLTSTIWELSFYTAAGNWSLHFRTANLVPDNAPIFELCYSGDFDGVRRLLDQQQASLFDYRRHEDDWSEGSTLLQAAALSGNLHLCHYLLNKSEHSPFHQYASRSLDSYVVTRTWHLPVGDTSSMYRLMLDHMDADECGVIQDGANLVGMPFWWWACPSAPCVRLARNHLRSMFGSAADDLRFGWAMQTHSWKVSLDEIPAIFLEALGYDHINEYVTSRADDSGTTALHMAAEALERSGSHDLQHTGAFATFVTELIQNGAELHRRDNAGCTALRRLAPRLGTLHSSYNVTLRFWVNLLDKAGVDIALYGRRERDLWFHQQGPASSYDPLLPSIGAHADDWAWLTPQYGSLSVYTPVCSPGEWECLDERLPWVLAWAPEQEDDLPGLWRWSLGGYIYFPAKDVSPAIQSSPFDDREHLTSLDDGNIIVHALRKALMRAKYPSPRRSSLPELGRSKIGTVQDGNRWRGWHHCCMFDGQRIMSPEWIDPISRSCAKGHHVYDAEFLWTGPHGINEGLRRFKLRWNNRHELQELPYAAYHDIWRRG